MAIIRGMHARLIKEQVETALKRKGYAFFDGNKKYNLNLVGIRNSSGSAKKFDDTLLVLYRDDDKDWELLSCEITTEPGPSILRKPINEAGTAILVPDQYRGVYKIDTHGGKNRHIALCQRNGPVKVYRDTDKDGIPETVGREIQEGMFGINIHRHARPDEKEYVGGSSAGCQVFKSSRQFAQFMDVCNRAADKYGNSFTYTLIKEKDL